MRKTIGATIISMVVSAGVSAGILACALKYYQIVKLFFWHQQHRLELLHKKELLYSFIWQDLVDNEDKEDRKVSVATVVIPTDQEVIWNGVQDVAGISDSEKRYINNRIEQQEIKPGSTVLFVIAPNQHNKNIVYYLAKLRKQDIYKLYRSDFINKPIALIGAVDNFTVKVTARNKGDNIPKTDDFSGERQPSESPGVHTKCMTGVSESSQQPRKFICAVDKTEMEMVLDFEVRYLVGANYESIRHHVGSADSGLDKSRNTNMNELRKQQSFKLVLPAV